jgi:hypothetical protein
LRVHEDLSRRHEVTPASDRSFGFVMATAMGLFSLVPLWSGAAPVWWLLGVAAAFAAAATVRPRVLRPLNAAWMKLGLLLNRVTNPILLAAVFYLAVLPTGLFMRATGRDPLRRKRDPRAASYWIPREPGQSSSMTRQF